MRVLALRAWQGTVAITIGRASTCWDGRRHGQMQDHGLCQKLLRLDKLVAQARACDATIQLCSESSRRALLSLEANNPMRVSHSTHSVQARSASDISGDHASCQTVLPTSAAQEEAAPH